MKVDLFVYKLVLGKDIYGDKVGFTSTRIEVEETAKSYKVNHREFFKSRKLISKASLGRVDTSVYNDYVVVLSEDNLALAKELLTSHFKEKLDFAKRVYEGHLTEFNTAVSLMDSN